jgi:putative FmdB family regulatory protein
MPMYEFFCPDCNTIFTFFSRTVNTEKIPACPKCGRQGLERMISRFAVTGRAGESAPGEGAGDLGQLDTGRMEKAMEAMASEAEGIDENNPRQAADLMRRFSAISGLRFGDKMEDALSRLEAGEDPEALEKDMADLDESDLFKLDRADEAAGKKARSVRRKAPLRDETMYEL